MLFYQGKGEIRTYNFVNEWSAPMLKKGFPACLQRRVSAHNFNRINKMFKTAVIATALLQASATKLEVEDYSTKALTSTLVADINVSRNPICFCLFNFILPPCSDKMLIF